MTEHEANAAADWDAEIKRVPTHVPGLDAILSGGFLSGGVYLIEGLAGMGKTVLASQISTAMPRKAAALSLSQSSARTTLA